MRNTWGLLFVAFLISSTFMVLNANSISTNPSVPEFTLKFVDNSYYVPPTYSTNQYTGQAVITQAGYEVENNSVEVIIRNQNFDNYKDSNGNDIRLNYDVRFRGHFGDSWAEINGSLGGIYVTASNSITQESGGKVSLVSPNAQYTVITYGLTENNGSDYYSVRLAGASYGSQVDFQVDALVGYYTQVMASPVPGFRNSYYYVFNGQSSGWSDTQTITIPNNLNPTNRTIQPTASPTQTPAAPLQPSAQSKVLFGLSWDEVAIITLSAVVVVLVAATLFYRGRSVRQTKHP